MLQTLSGLARPDEVLPPAKETLDRLGHELRPALAVIALGAHLLEPSVADAGGKTALAHVRKAADRLGDVVEDLLLLARLGGGDPCLAMEPFALEDAARDAAAACEASARARGARLELPARARGCRVLGERAVVARALRHLICNAVAFGPAGGRVTVLVEPLQRGYEVSVCDDGPGVPAHLLPALFRPFFQAEPLMTREVGGLGLGLSLVRLAAERHRGAVTAFSRPGCGSRFGLWLPAAS